MNKAGTLPSPMEEVSHDDESETGRDPVEIQPGNGFHAPEVSCVLNTAAVMMSTRSDGERPIQCSDVVVELNLFERATFKARKQDR